MSLSALSDSFEYLCYGSTAIIKIYLLVQGWTLDTRIWRLQTSNSEIHQHYDYSPYKLCFIVSQLQRLVLLKTRLTVRDWKPPPRIIESLTQISVWWLFSALGSYELSHSAWKKILQKFSSPPPPTEDWMIPPKCIQEKTLYKIFMVSYYPIGWKFEHDLWWISVDLNISGNSYLW